MFSFYEILFLQQSALSQSSSAPAIGTINYVNQSGQSYPMTAYLTASAHPNTALVQSDMATINSHQQQQSTTTAQLQLQTPIVAAAQANNQPQVKIMCLCVLSWRFLLM